MIKDFIERQSGFGRPVNIRYHGEVAVLEIDRGENRINLDFIQRINAALDEVERNPTAKALITTGKGKFYSNGIDLDWMGTSARSDPNTGPVFRRNWLGLVLRFLTFPMPTIAALNGHTFAGGAFFSLTHDYRIMRSDRGWFSINEVHLGLPLNPLLRELVRTKVSGVHISDVVVMGKRLTGPEAKDAGIVTSICSAEQLEAEAVALARRCLPPGGIRREFMTQMKKNVYENILRRYDEDMSTGSSALIAVASAKL